MYPMLIEKKVIKRHEINMCFVYTMLRHNVQYILLWNKVPAWVHLFNSAVIIFQLHTLHMWFRFIRRPFRIFIFVSND
jgi:hypothetical protein